MGRSKKSKTKQPKLLADDIDVRDVKLDFSDSDPDEKILLDEVLSSKKKYEGSIDNETSIYGLDNSSSDDEELGEEEEDESDEEMDDLKEELADSDIDGMEEDDLPNLKAWGKNKKTYYNTDYVDDDHGGFLEEEDEMAAELEEKEAMAIQKRLTAEIENTDDVFDFLIKNPEEDSNKTTSTEEVICKDLSEMSKKEKILLLEKESPEFVGLVNDFNNLMKDVKLHLLPIINLLDKGKIPSCVAGDSIRLRFELILNYCTNICFYILMKLKRHKISDHPVIHRLVAAKQLIMKLENIYQDQLLPQIELILQTDNLTTLIEPISNAVQKIKKKSETSKENKNNMASGIILGTDKLEEAVDQDDTFQKRAITYQIAKNRGLTPHRKKELKNPRVKHKLKFRKAKIRRKGQVREPRKELDRYGGEMSGIKASVRKSITIK